LGGQLVMLPQTPLHLSDMQR